MKPQLGRIENEPDSVYFGGFDKPAFGSSALKVWMTDQELFYHRYVAKDVPMPQIAQGGLGHALEESLLERRFRVLESQYKTVCAGYWKEVEANPESNVLTVGQYTLWRQLHEAGFADGPFMDAVEFGKAQVTYRYDAGPFYVQARIDLELDTKDIPERICRYYGFDPLSTKKLLIDLKKCQTHYGKGAFRNAALRQFHYPVQQALYTHVVAEVEGRHRSEVEFRFQAISEAELKSQAYSFIDIDDSAWNQTMDGLDTLKHRFRSNDWSDFTQPCQQVIVPENYLQWGSAS